jgi:hypothetical protein
MWVKWKEKIHFVLFVINASSAEMVLMYLRITLRKENASFAELQFQADGHILNE